MIERLDRGVYRQPGAPATGEQRLRAALLRCGEDARISGWSACALYGIEGFELRWRPWIVVPRDHRVRGVELTVRRADVDRCDLATVTGMPSVTPIRALIDVASRVPDTNLRVGIDDARRRSSSLSRGCCVAPSNSVGTVAPWQCADSSGPGCSTRTASSSGSWPCCSTRGV